MNHQDFKSREDWQRWLEFLYINNPEVAVAVDEALVRYSLPSMSYIELVDETEPMLTNTLLSI